MKIPLPLILTIIILMVVNCTPKTDTRQQQVEKKAAAPRKPVKITHDTICIAAVGDIMLGSSFPDSSKLPPDSAKSSFRSVMNDLKGADITFGNLEGTLLDTGGPDIHKKKQDSAYLFRMPVKYAQVLKSAGFNMLSIANNHITDFGPNGWLSTEKALDSNAIKYAGMQNKPYTIFNSNGVTFGFCAFAPNANTVSMLDQQNEARIIKRLKQQCDVVIVSFHGGAEGTAYEHVPFKVELYKGGNRGDVHQFAHVAVDAGADIVLGNGPHVCRGLENYKGRLIAYSLGNFCTYKSVSVMGVCGYAPLLKVYIDKKGRFLYGNIIAYRQTHEKGLVRDTLNKVVSRMKLLSEQDFPDPGLVISGRGRIEPTAIDE